MQLWEFYRVKSADMKAQFTKACMNQSAARTSTELVVFVTRQDKWQNHANWNLEKTLRTVSETDKRYKQLKNYYGRLMPLFYKNDFLGIATLIRCAVVSYYSLRSKPIIRLVTHADQRVSVHKSCGLAAQTFMYSMTAEGFATCPMEGFDEKIVKKLLNLPSQAEICMIIACGKATPEGIYSERFRLPYNEVVFEV